MRCFVVAGFLLTSASRGPSAIAEFLVWPTLYIQLSRTADDDLHDADLATVTRLSNGDKDRDDNDDVATPEQRSVNLTFGNVTDVVEIQCSQPVIIGTTHQRI